MRSLSWRLKLFLLLMLFAIAPLVALAYMAIASQHDSLRAATLDGLRAIATAKGNAIEQFADDRIRDVERISGLMSPRVQAYNDAKAAHPPLVPRVPVPLPDVDHDAAGAGTGTDAGSTSPPPSEDLTPEPALPPGGGGGAAVDSARDGMHRALGLILWDQKHFEEMLVIDPTGLVVASTFRDHVGMTAVSLEYFQQGRRTTYLQPMFLSPITKQLTMVVATPIRGGDGETIGVLAARLNLGRFFRLIGDATGLGDTGETVVAKRVDDRVLFMAPTRHDPDAAFQRSVALGAAIARSLQEAARGQHGQGPTRDYRGVQTLGAWRHLPSLDWGLLVKVDVSEAMRSATVARNRTFVLAVVLILSALLASVLATRTLIKPLRDLKDATDRISRGDFAVQLDIRSRDEIGELADSFERMVAAIKFFRERAGRAPDEPEADAVLGEPSGERPEVPPEPPPEAPPEPPRE
jgi:HAMP domain-containing protein